jgi:hypothetical protein
VVAVLVVQLRKVLGEQETLGRQVLHKLGHRHRGADAVLMATSQRARHRHCNLIDIGRSHAEPNGLLVAEQHVVSCDNEPRETSPTRVPWAVRSHERLPIHLKPVSVSSN